MLTPDARTHRDEGPGDEHRPSEHVGAVGGRDRRRHRRADRGGGVAPGRSRRPGVRAVRPALGGRGRHPARPQLHQDPGPARGAAGRRAAWRSGRPRSSSAAGTTAGCSRHAARRRHRARVRRPLPARPPRRPGVRAGGGGAGRARDRRAALHRGGSGGPVAGPRCASPTARPRSPTWWSGRTASTPPCARPVRRRGPGSRPRRLPRAHPRRARRPPGPRADAARSGSGRARTSCTTTSVPAASSTSVCVVEERTWTRESWTDRGDVAELRAAFAGWHPVVAGIVDALDAPLKWALFDRDPLPRWSRGVVTLLGDAATRCCPSGRRARPRRSRTPPCWPRASRTARTSRSALARYESARRRADRARAGDLAGQRRALPPSGRAPPAGPRRGDGRELRPLPRDRLAVRPRRGGRASGRRRPGAS